jgi:predicted glycosyltransferase
MNAPQPGSTVYGSASSGQKRVLIYSHDTFGLGHLRRCRTIAHTLVASNPDLSVLILSGSPIIGQFDFGERVDFVRIPGVIKLKNGEYTSLSLGMAIEQTVALRAAIIEQTAAAFAPGLFIVDKEPFGLRGEVKSALERLNRAGVPCVLGLRDVLDDPVALAREWRRKGASVALTDFYEEIWIYGLPQICDPLKGLRLPKSVRRKASFTGYLRRTLPPGETVAREVDAAKRKIGETFMLVTPGGGGDGAKSVDWVLRAYEQDPAIPLPALIVFGPFMPADQRQQFHRRAQKLDNVAAITFNAHLERLVDEAEAIVAMGGYNTFCEILSFDKPALLLPRVAPRREQLIRATEARMLGLVSMLDISGETRTETMATALRHLPQQAKPSSRVIPGLLDGLENVNRLASRLLVREADTQHGIALLDGAG